MTEVSTILVEERRRAAEVIRRFESGGAWLSDRVESGEVSAWAAMVEIHILPAVATIDALCRLRVVEAEEEGRLPRALAAGAP